MSRLVIRIKLPPREPTPAPEPPRLRKSALLPIAAGVVVVLVVIGIFLFRSEPATAPAPSQVASPQVSDRPAPQLAPATVETKPVEAAPTTSPSPISEVLPEVPRGALNTIRGTIRVTIRAIVDEEGKVLDATVQEQGASRYFARLALDASRKWTFAPSTSQEQRVMQIRFYFKRSGVTASASP